MRIHGVEFTGEEVKQWVKNFLDRRERELKTKKTVKR
jgi:hypothetical protein